MLSHNQLLRDDIVGSHHADEVDAGGEVLHVHLAAVVVDALAQYRSAVVVINRQFADDVEGGAYGEDIVGRVREEGDVFVEIMHVNTIAVNNHEGDMNGTIAAINSGSGHVDIQNARILWREVQTVVVIMRSDDGGVGYLHFVSRVNGKEEDIDTVAAIHGLVVFVIQARGVAMDTVPYEIFIVAGAGGIYI